VVVYYVAKAQNVLRLIIIIGRGKM
jgi:hypothetical protein